MKGHFLICCWLLLTLVAGAPAQAASAAGERNLEQLASAIEKTMAREGIPGAQVALFDASGVYWSRAFGLADREAGLAMQPDTRMHGASTTKTFIALAIMQLVERGHFSLQDPIASIVPEVNITNPWRESAPVRVVHLLEHTAGFDDMHFRNLFNLSQPGIRMLDAVNRDAAALRVRWQPGTRHSYANPGYGVLGHLIEKFAGVPFEQYLQTHVLPQLGMGASRLQLTDTVKEHMSRGYVDGKPIPLRQIYLRSAGSLYTSAEELAQAGRYLLTLGASAELDGIGPDTIRAMETPTTSAAAQAGLGHGYGLGIYHALRGGQHWLGHNGGFEGFFTSYGYSRELGRGYAVMTNTSSGDLRALLLEVTAFLDAQRAVVPVPATPGASPGIGGYYRLANERNQLFRGLSYALGITKVAARGDRILVQPVVGETKTYLHVGGQKFRPEDAATASGIFLADTPDGSVLQLDGQYLVEVSWFSAWGPVVLIALLLIALLAIACYLPVWLVSLARGRLGDRRRLLMRALPILASTALAAVIYAIASMDLFAAGRFNWQTVTVFAGSVLFAVFGLAGLVVIIRHWRAEPRGLARWFTLTASLAIVAFSGYLAMFDYVGLALWSW